MGTLLIVTRLFQMGFLCGSGRKFGGFVDLDLGKPAILVGAGHWLHDTPPIFANRIMRFLKHRSWVRDRTNRAHVFRARCLRIVSIAQAALFEAGEPRASAGTRDRFLALSLLRARLRQVSSFGRLAVPR